MRKILGRLWNKINEPHVEKLLMVFIPFATLIIVGLILSPSILSLMESAPVQTATAPPIYSQTPEDEEGYAHLSQAEEQQVQSEEQVPPSPSPEPVETPAPLSDRGALLGWQNIGGLTYYYNENGLPVTGLQQINGKLYFFDQYGQCAKALGIDLSFYNGFINWPAVAAQGIDYAILRAGGRGWETGLIYEDEWIVAVDKPAGIPTVPGRNCGESLLELLKKRYVALLDGMVKADSGTISLPLRPDYGNRPMQIVDDVQGNPATTRYEVIKRNCRNGTTLVYFYPFTGRTHQLRVHSAHCRGLGIPIVGDRLYGRSRQPEGRMYLHAESVSFVHPRTGAGLELHSLIPSGFGHAEQMPQCMPQ